LWGPPENLPATINFATVNAVGDRERTIPSTLIAEDLVLGKLQMLNEGGGWQPGVFRSKWMIR
jgi:hypothetical protein